MKSEETESGLDVHGAHDPRESRPFPFPIPDLVLDWIVIVIAVVG